MKDNISSPSSGSRYIFKELMNVTSIRIQNILQMKGCMSVRRLIKLTHENDELVYQALHQLAEEGKITSEIRGKTEYVEMTSKNM